MYMNITFITVSLIHFTTSLTYVRATMDEVRQEFAQEKEQWQIARTEEISSLMDTYSQAR